VSLYFGARAADPGVTCAALDTAEGDCERRRAKNMLG
jgi:hypothetical protein